MKKTNHEEKPKKRVLLIHYGFSGAAHFNRYELILKLLKKKSNIDIDLLKCDGLLPICGYHELPIGTLPNEIINFESYITSKNCARCQRRLSKTRLVSQFSANLISLSAYLNEQDEAEISTYLDGVKDLSNLHDYLQLVFDGVNVGVDAWQSVQRNLKLGKSENLVLASENTVKGALYSSLRIARFMKNLLADKHYDLILTNETVYLDWGVPARVGLAHNIPVLREGESYFCGDSFLNLALYQTVDELERTPWDPSPSELEKVLSNDSVESLDLEISGKNKLHRWMIPTESFLDYNNFSAKKFLSDESLRALKKLLSLKNSNVKKPLVGVFCHLCWDSALSYGDMLYETFEDWLTGTISSAVKADHVNWVFKVHPAELTGKVNNQFNTYLHIKNVLASYANPDHISIIREPMPSGVLLPLVDIGVTALGTVAFELPAQDKPCLVASRGGYAKLPFVRSPETIIRYEKQLIEIDKINPVTNDEQRCALRYAGLMFDRRRYLDTRPLGDWVKGRRSILALFRLSNYIFKTDLKFRSTNDFDEF